MSCKTNKNSSVSKALRNVQRAIETLESLKKSLSAGQKRGNTATKTAQKSRRNSKS